tara:strand:+ start:4061 stop:4942 length:882 start_codon:yes stop_codon:yes gene_type:complete
LKNTKNIVINIKGGFGNQIFQFAFAKKLESQGFNVYVDTRFYNQFLGQEFTDTYRQQIISETIFGFTNINDYFSKFLEINEKIGNSNKLKTIYKNFENPLYKKLKDSDFNYDLLNRKFIRLDGYWQNIQNILDQKEFITNSLRKISVLKESFDRVPEKNSTMLIVRRGDYIKMNENLDIDFYKECIGFINDKISNNFKLNIFTDDVNWVKENKLFKNANEIFGPEDNPVGVLSLFSKMIEHQHFIVCNSTFSLLAALLNEQKESYVLVADPWFRNKEKNLMYKDNWVKIQNNS